jgi:hypothetical protein
VPPLKRPPLLTHRGLRGLSTLTRVCPTQNETDLTDEQATDVQIAGNWIRSIIAYRAERIEIYGKTKPI